MPRGTEHELLVGGLASSFLAAGLAAAGFCGAAETEMAGAGRSLHRPDHRHVALHHVFEVDGDVASFSLHISFIRFTRLVP